MIRKPDLTPEQMKSFEDQFTDLMKDAPDELRKQWGGKVEWNPILQRPLLDDIARQFNRSLADRYVALLNKLDSRFI